MSEDGELRIAEVKWEHQEPGNGWLLRQVFDLLLRDPGLPRARTDPDLTDGDTPLTMEPQAIPDEEGGER